MSKISILACLNSQNLSNTRKSILFIACSSELQSQRSQPLKKKKGDRSKSARQRIVPLDPLDDVPLPKGFPDGPPPKPSDPLDELFSEGNYH